MFGVLRISTAAAVLVGTALVTPGVAVADGPTVIELESLGGGQSGARDINDKGAAVGFADTGTGERHAVRWDSRGRIIDLGTLGHRGSEGNQINATGMVAGTVDLGEARHQAARWDRFGNGTLLELLHPGEQSDVSDISDTGIVVGNATSPDLDRWSFHAVRWERDGSVVDLGLSDVDSGAEAVNNAGTTVGWTYLPDTSVRAVRWDRDGTTTYLDQLPGTTSSYAFDINDRGEIVGTAYAPDRTRAVRWDAAGRVTELGVLPGGRSSVAQAVSEDGTVVGNSTVDDQHESYSAVRWNPDGTMTDLGAQLPGERSVAHGINDAGTIIGESGVDTLDSYAVRWDASGNVVELPPLAGGTAGTALAINDSGTIAGWSDKNEVWFRAVLWVE